MKLYGIIESYLDYKGADASNWGVATTLKKALKQLIEVLEQQFYYIRENFIEDALTEDDKIDEEKLESLWQGWINEHLTKGDGTTTYCYKWEYDNGDCVYKFYIDELELPK